MKEEEFISHVPLWLGYKLQAFALTPDIIPLHPLDIYLIILSHFLQNDVADVLLSRPTTVPFPTGDIGYGSTG